MNIRNKILALSITFICTGCSSFGIDGPFLNSRTLEAHERMLLVSDKATRKVNNGKYPLFKGNNRVVCAEPSPDAIMALAASGALEGKGIKASGAFSEAVGELGERTPVIQLLRDSLFRSCEAYMNGLLDDVDYADILAFFDVYSATLLGIESLNHISRPPVIVQTSANSNITNKKESEGDSSNKNEESEADLGAKGSSTPPGNITITGQRSDKVAEKVSEILKDYHKIKAKLFLFREAKKLYESNKLSTDDYIKLLTSSASENKD
jgi:hypothetical protein